MRTRWNRCLHTLEGHSGSIGNICFTPDSRTIFTSASLDQVRCWDVDRGVENEISLPELDRCLGALSPNGRVLASIARSMDEISLFDTITGEKIQQFDLQDPLPLGMLQFTANSQSIFFTQVNTFAKLFKMLKIDTGEEILSIRVEDWRKTHLDEAVLSPNGNLVAADMNGKLTIWSAITGEKMLLIDPSPIYVSRFVFSPDGQSVAGSGIDGRVYIWDTMSGLEKFKVQAHISSYIAFSPDGKRVATGSVSDLTLWDIETGSMITVFRGHSDFIDHIAFSPDGERVASGSRDGTIRIWDAAQPKSVYEDQESGPWSKTFGMCFSSDSRAVHTVRDEVDGNYLTTTDVLGVLTDEVRITEDTGSFFGLRSFSPYSEKFAVLSSFGTDFLVFNKKTAIARYPARRFTQFPGYYKFSPDGSLIVNINVDGDVKVFDVFTGEAKKTLNLGTFSNEPHWKHSLAVSANCRLISIVSPQSVLVHIWDIHTGKVEDFTANGIQFDTVLAVSSCGHKIVAACNNDERSLAIWDLAAGSQVQNLLGASYLDIHDGVFTPDDKYLWTNWGFLSLHPSSGTSLLQEGDPNLCLFVSKDWITRAGEPILWLPPDYRPISQAVSYDTVVLICDGNWMSIQFCNES